MNECIVAQFFYSLSMTNKMCYSDFAGWCHYLSNNLDRWVILGHVGCVRMNGEKTTLVVKANMSLTSVNTNQVQELQWKLCKCSIISGIRPNWRQLWQRVSIHLSKADATSDLLIWHTKKLQLHTIVTN